MEFEEANKIFKSWQEYQEIHDKLVKFFIFFGIPESFLPYSQEVLGEAINIVAKQYFDVGEHEISDDIKRTIGFLLFYKKDKEVLDEIMNIKEVLKDHRIKECVLSELKKAKDSWDRSKGC